MHISRFAFQAKEMTLPNPLFSLLFLLALSGSVLAASLTTPDGGNYEGEVKNGLLHGDGRIDWPDGTYYVGSFHNGLKHGEGTELLLDGRIYRGEYQNGQWEDGVLHFPNGQTYEGEFERQRFDGKGKLTFGNRTVYEGDFRAGKMEGEGQMTTADGTVYEGTFSGDRLMQGTLTSRDGSVYEGMFKAGQRDGQGAFTRPDGFSYTGQWKDGQISGTGIATYATGDVYEGEFLNGKRSGEGVMRYKDGAVTEGSSNNAYIVKGNTIITRHLGNEILHGITRAAVLRFAREAQMTVEERSFTIAEAQEADEAFVTSASTFVMPVVEIDDVAVGAGTPGAVVARLREIYLEEMRKAAI